MNCSTWVCIWYSFKYSLKSVKIWKKRKPKSAASEQFLAAKAELLEFKRQEAIRALPKPKPAPKRKKLTLNENMKQKQLKLKDFTVQKWLKQTKKDWKNRKKQKKSNLKLSINRKL